VPLEYWRWRLVRELGWTLAEVDALSLADFHEYLQVTDGEHKARNDAGQRVNTKWRR
jgi:hypothetical protein